MKSFRSKPYFGKPIWYTSSFELYIDHKFSNSCFTGYNMSNFWKVFNVQHRLYAPAYTRTTKNKDSFFRWVLNDKILRPFKGGI